MDVALVDTPCCICGGRALLQLREEDTSPRLMQLVKWDGAPDARDQGSLAGKDPSIAALFPVPPIAG